MAWPRARLGDIVSLQYGKSLPADLRDPHGKFPVAGSNGPHGQHTSGFVSSPGIVVGRKGSAGSVYWYDEDFWPIDTTYYVVPKIPLDMRWTYFLLSHLQLHQLATTTGVPGLNRNDVYNLEIQLPSVAEQRRIVEILDKADRLRRLRAKADATAVRILPALFIKMFGDPATNPMGWPVCRLGDLSTIGPQYGANARSVALSRNQPRYVRITDIDDRGGLKSDDAVGIDMTDWEPYRLLDGDLLFARSGATVGKTYIHSSDYGSCVFAGYLIRFHLDKTKLDPLIAFGFTQTSAYRAWVDRKRRAAAQPNINGKEYASLKLPVPDPALQGCFCSIYSQLKDTHRSLVYSRDELEQLFSVLLNRALSGA